jgi:hypothetical protein
MLAAMKVDPHRVISDEQLTPIENPSERPSLLAARPTTSSHGNQDAEESAAH